MKTATVTQFRTKMKEHLQEIVDDQDILILTGPKKKDFVVLTLDEYNSMEETVHLLSTVSNSSRLLESVAQDKAGLTKSKKIGIEPKTKSKKAVIRKRK